MSEITHKQKSAQKNRFAITVVVLGTFFIIMLGIGFAILGVGGATVDQEWKEILLLVLGAFLGSYSRIIDFWFNASDDDGIPGESHHPQNHLSGPSYCDNCGENIDYDKF